MKPLTFYVDETYRPGLVGLLQEKGLHAVTYRDANDIIAGDPDVAWIPMSRDATGLRYPLTSDSGLGSRKASDTECAVTTHRDRCS